MASIFYRKGESKPTVGYIGCDGKEHTKRCPDHKTALTFRRKVETDAFNRREGLVDAGAEQYAQAALVPLVEKNVAGKVTGGHLADYRAVLLAKGDTAKHAALTINRTAAILAKAQIEKINQLTPSAVQEAIASLHEPSKDWPQGRSLATCNHHLRAVKGFSKWLWRDKRAREDVLVHLTGYNPRLDRRHDRRALSDDELGWLIATVEKGPVVGGMGGSDRAMFYRLAAGTGFRVNEIASLTPESFDLETGQPTITVAAAYSKRRRQDVQPIRQDLADVLRPWLSGRTAGEAVFTLPGSPSRMIQRDLYAAKMEWLKTSATADECYDRWGSDYLKYSTAEGFADCHALRHTYVSRLVRSGANVKIAQELARHSTPMLTLGRYAHMGLVDQKAALDALPVVTSPAPENDHEIAVATGTDGRPQGQVVSKTGDKCLTVPATVLRGQNGPTDANARQTAKSGDRGNCSDAKSRKSRISQPFSTRRQHPPTAATDDKRGGPSRTRTEDTRIMSPNGRL